MTTVVLVRHGRTAANSSGVLAGWTAGVGLDDTGRDQAAAAGRRLAAVRFAALVSSPLERCQETARLLLEASEAAPELSTDDRLGEVHYGDWTGAELKKLAKDPLWKIVQGHPSAVSFPGDGGESLRSMQERAVSAVREWNARLGDNAVWAAVSHGDVIKAVLADALGLHLDAFQRIVVDPCSVSIVHYTPLRPFVVRLNDTGDDLARLLAPPKRRRRRRARNDSDAVVGGGAGTAS